MALPEQASEPVSVGSSTYQRVGRGMGWFGVACLAGFSLSAFQATPAYWLLFLGVIANAVWLVFAKLILKFRISGMTGLQFGALLITLGFLFIAEQIR